LTPHLQACAEADTAEDTGLEEVRVRLGSLRALEAYLLPDLRELELNELVVRVALAVQVSQDLERLVLAVMVDEPPGTLRVISASPRLRRVWMAGRTSGKTSMPKLSMMAGII
jgi:hypothetical protein